MARFPALALSLLVLHLDGGAGGRRHHAALILPAGVHPPLPTRDARALWSQLRHPTAAASPAANRSVAVCAAERRAGGVGTCWASAPCQNLASIVSGDNEGHSIGDSSIEKECDILLYWLNELQLENNADQEKHKPSSLEVWGYGILSSGLISLSGIGGLVLYPIMTKGYFVEIMNFLIGLSFGSLSTTSIFQLLPESFGVMEFDEEYLFKALIAWGSIWIFYNIGVFTAILSVNGKTRHSHSHACSTKTHRSNSPIEQRPLENGLEMTTHQRTPEDVDNSVFLSPTQRSEFRDGGKVNQKKISAVALMIIFGDSLHNFVDGMSIGAGYSQNLMTGLSISLAVACEEFPHEFGDFAVLIKSGFSFRRALKFNYASASTIFLGLIVGILLGQLDTSIYIYAFAGGLFLYISLGELVPELKDMIKEEKLKGFKQSIVAYLLQNFGMIMGALALYLVTKYL
ncbi:metal cation symporter ZIP8-like [Hetaerina americana]|uniref:metal cation symporter ZIP8-like n=1 Tax=Hetaerina americana TaxID=62018 RepID=UPI003A7F2490